ncbi:cytochrome P450 2F3-like isoform X4 [Hyperolius riggenbachi]|uniref:cytochrome P450 2F3-like isoform X4 n=1 Tax=Hyperolius riggenbachi TaxID=752182 RepID=UPI0035A27BB0
MLALLIILISICCCIFSTWYTMYKNRNFPPGPTPLPLIGNLLNIERGALVNSLMKLWKQFGPVYTLYFGSKPVIVICGYEAFKEALVDQNDVFGARGETPTIDRFTKGRGIIFSNGEKWKLMRTFTFKTLRDFGFGKKSFEGKMQEETRCLVEELRRSQGQPMNPTRCFSYAFANVVCSVVFGERFDYSDERFSKLIGIVEDIFRTMSSTWGQIYSIFPLMKYVPGPHHKVVSISEEFIGLMAEIVKSCQETLDPEKPRHFIDCFLIKIEEEKNNPCSEFTLESLLYTLHSLLLGASDTVSTTLRHALLIFLKYPDVEDKIREEIDRVIGRDRLPEMDDRLNMPYTQAVMHEVQRFSDIAPLCGSHMVTKDVHFRGYFIPKGTDIYPLLCTVHRDPTQFATPYKFNPNHFLDENGQFKKNDAWMPFSAGKRMCPGEYMARMEFFILLTTILQNFTLSSEKEFTEDEVAPKLAGVINSPIQYELSFIPR